MSKAMQLAFERSIRALDKVISDPVKYAERWFDTTGRFDTCRLCKVAGSRAPKWNYCERCCLGPEDEACIDLPGYHDLRMLLSNILFRSVDPIEGTTEEIKERAQEEARKLRKAALKKAKKNGYTLPGE